MIRALAILAITPAIAFAHLGSTKYLLVDGTDVVIELDPIDVAYQLELDDPESPNVAEILRHGDAIRAWLERVEQMRSDAGVCTGHAGPPSAIARSGAIRSGQAIRVEIAYECPGSRNLVLHDDAIFESDAQHEAIVRANGNASILRRGRQEIAIDEAPSIATTSGRFVIEGALHLATGYDHLLFLLSLLLVAGRVAARDGVRKAGRDVAFIVTAFTLGHSVTLIAAALDIVTLPSRWIETAIAGSIVVVAILNLRKENARAGLPSIAFVFGLVHGFGFSSVLRELVLPTSDRVVALLSFNVGIEIAQLAFVALAIGPLAWAARKRWYEPAIVRGGSWSVAAVASFWLVQRAFAL